MRHVFGPVPSRRLGRSLGIDVVPFKTCSYDCIYCQLGRTTCKTTERRAWVGWEPLLDELKQSLDTRPDYITFSGSGEPTLHAGLGMLIERIKSMTSIPVAVLTNGSLLWRADVRQDLLQADLVIPSLDVGDELRFRCINRPHESLSFERVLEGLIAFKQEFTGQYWLEVFLLGGYTSVPAEAARIAECVQRIRPDRVQLNTVTRPGAETFAEAVPAQRLTALAGLFQPQAEVIVDLTPAAAEPLHQSTVDDILNTLRRRPCRIEDLVAAHGLHRNEALKDLDVLMGSGAVECAVTESGLYYRTRQPREGTESTEDREAAS